MAFTFRAILRTSCIKLRTTITLISSAAFYGTILLSEYHGQWRWGNDPLFQRKMPEPRVSLMPKYLHRDACFADAPGPVRRHREKTVPACTGHEFSLIFWFNPSDTRTREAPDD